VPRLPSLTSLAVRLESEATRIRSSVRPPDLELASDLLVTATTLRRLARSGPVLVRVVAASGGTPPIFSETTVLLDLQSFLASAEMAATTFAGHQLRSSGVAPVGNQTPWRLYLDRVEATSPRPSTIHSLRRLDLRLVEARHRLLAHRLRDHHLEVTTFHKSMRAQIGLRPSTVRPADDRAIRLLAAKVSATATGAMPDVVDSLIQQAGRLSKGDRRAVARLLRGVGYRSGDPSLIVADLLDLTATIR
jgi:hypothetical protein